MKHVKRIASRYLNWPNRISLVRLLLVPPFVILLTHQNDPGRQPLFRLLALGLFVVFYAVYALLSRPGATLVSRHWAYLAGFSGGITSSLFGAGGPPYAIYLSHRPLSKEQFRATLTLNTVFSIGMRVTAFAVTGLMLKAEVGVAAAFAVLAAMVGLSLASWAFKRVTREFLLRVVAVLLLANGMSLIVRAAA